MAIFHRKNDDKNKIVELILFVLNFYGIYPFTENVNIFKQYRLIAYYSLMFGIGTVGNLVMLANLNSFIALQGFCFLCGTITFFVFALISLRNKENLRSFIESIMEEDEEWNKFSSKFDTYRVTYEQIRNMHYWFAVYSVVNCSSVAAYPLMNAVLQITPLGNLSSLIFLSWYPWSLKDWRWYSITYILQTLTAAIYQSIMYGTISLNLITWRLFSNECDQLRYVVHDLLEDASSSAQNRFDRSLKLCIIRHQKIVKKFNQYKKWFEDIYATLLLYYTIQFVLFGLLIFSAPDSKVRNILLLFNVTIILCVYCLIGEAFYSLNEKIQLTLYGYNWEGKDRKTVKLILMFMDQLQCPLRLQAFKTFPASLPVLFSILKSSYGFLNVSLATMK